MNSQHLSLQHSAVDSLIDSDSDGEVKITPEKKDSQSFMNRKLDNQTGFKFAEEIRRLKEELAKERQEKRLLQITNENLQEQLNNAEERMKQLETKEFITARRLSTTEDNFRKEAAQHRSSEEELQRLRSDRKHLKKELDKALQHTLAYKAKTDEISKQLNYWKECVSAYESKIKEFVTEKAMRVKSSDEQKQHISSLENALFKIKSKYVRFKQACFDIIAPQENSQFSQEKGLSLEINPRFAEEDFDFDAILKTIRKRNQVYIESRKTYKTYINKLIGVVKMYEEMMPTEEILECI